MPPAPLDTVLNLRVAAIEKAMLSELAERDGLKVSQYVRRWIHNAYRVEFGDTKPKRKR